MTEERNSSPVKVPYLRPGARFVANACRMLDCLSDAGSDGLTRREIAEASGVNISSLKGLLAQGVSLGVAVRLPGTEPSRYLLGDTPLTQADFERALPPGHASAALVKSLWILSCFKDGGTRTKQDIAAMTGLMPESTAANISALIAAGYLLAYPGRRGQLRRYRRTMKASLRGKRWVRLVMMSSSVPEAA